MGDAASAAATRGRLVELSLLPDRLTVPSGAARPFRGGLAGGALRFSALRLDFSVFPFAASDSGSNAAESRVWLLLAAGMEAADVTDSNSGLPTRRSKSLCEAIWTGLRY